MALPARVVDLTGQRFGRLTVVGFHGRREQPSGYKTTLWLCRCDCGKETLVMAWALRAGSTRSCGCFQRDRAVETHTRHGHARFGAISVEYRTWHGMHDRCTCPSHPSFEGYGGRGISVCERWSGRDGFSNFLVDMGTRPGRGFSIDRIDNDRGYSPDNCRWATAKQQASNRRPKRSAAEMRRARTALTAKG